MRKSKNFGPLVFLLEIGIPRKRPNDNEIRRKLANIRVFRGYKRVEAQNLELKARHALDANRYYRKAAKLFEEVSDPASAKRCLQKAGE